MLPGGQLDNIEEAGVDQPVIIQFVNRILADAINRKASESILSRAAIRWIFGIGLTAPCTILTACAANFRPPAPRVSRSWRT
jgi:hypothetical protein